MTWVKNYINRAKQSLTKSDFRIPFWFTIMVSSLYLVHNSDLGRFAKEELIPRFEFMVRERLDLAPAIDPRLKIYALDDYAVRKISRDELHLDNWAKIIATISKSKPKMIIIDKEFGIINNDEDYQSLQKTLKTSVPVYVGCHTKKAAAGPYTDLNNERFLDLSRPIYNLEKRLLHRNTKFDWLPILNHKTYGPKSELERYFYGVGHINYQHIGYVEPFRRVQADKVIPHLTLLASDSLKISNHEVVVDQHPVKLDSRNLLPINFPSKNELYASTKSLYPVYKRAEQNRTLKKVKEGDIVLILPLFFTGNTDMGLTPIGRVPRGLVLAAILNSILTKKWLHPVNISNLLIPAAAFFGAGIGLSLVPLWFWVATVGLCTVTLVGSLALFCLLGLIIPWFSFIVPFFTAGIIFFSIKMSRQSRVSQAYKIALSGLVSHNSLKELIHNPEAISREPSEQLITIMFLDLVSFSRMAQNTDPQIVFSRLKETMAMFSSCVHKYGGVVDKTMGDGMLCFFGYNYIGGQASDNHADQAILCAKAIQLEHAKMGLSNLAKNNPIIPVRIGINSAKVYIGDLGDEGRIDFTLIGSGVNFAQRLEAACDPFSILISEDSLQLSKDFHLGLPEIRKRKIKIKHQKALVNAIEYLPFFYEGDVLEQCKTVFYQKDPSRDRSARWPVHDTKPILLTTSIGEATLVNFSRSGFALQFKIAHLPGDVFILHLKQLSSSTESFLRLNQIPEISCEVRWCVSEGAKNLHGIRIINLSELEQEIVYEALKEILKKLGIVKPMVELSCQFLKTDELDNR